MSLKVVMIGAGSRANDVIYPSFADLRAEGLVDIAGICDTDPERLQTTADKFNIINRYGDNRYVFEYQKMIEELQPAAAVVIGQPEIMFNIWMWCLEKGLHLYIEKPMALTIHQARSLEFMAKQKSLVTQVSLQRRYSPMITELRNEARKRGEITHAVCKFYKSAHSNFIGARDHMMDDTVHAIDTLRWMTDSEVKKLDSVTRRIGTIDINFIMAQMSFENGAVGHLMNNWSSGKRIFAVEMHAPGIFIEAEHETKGYMYADADLKPIEYDAAKSAGSDAFHVSTGVLAAARDFVNACLHGGRPMSNFSDAVKTMKVAEMLLAQSLLAE